MFIFANVIVTEYLHKCFKIKHSQKELPQQIHSVLIAAFHFFNLILKKTKSIFPSNYFLRKFLYNPCGNISVIDY